MGTYGQRCLNNGLGGMKMSKYIVRENNEVILKTGDRRTCYSIFLCLVRKTIICNEGFFGPAGLPFSFEAYLCVSDEVCGNDKLLKKADDILGLFKQIQTLDGSSVPKAELGTTYLSSEDWEFEFNAKDRTANLISFDGIYYLRTNIFNNLREASQLYFKYYLEKVIASPGEIPRLGAEIRGEITFDKID